MNGSVLVNLKQEPPTLLATAAGLNKDAGPFQWWKNHSNALPYWFAAAKKIIHVQSSSAAAERGFSLLQNSFVSYSDMLHLLAMSKHLLCFSITKDM